MKKLFLLSLFSLFCLCVFSQGADTIEIKKTKYRLHGKNLMPRQLLEITKANPEAYKEMKIAKGQYDAGYAFSFIGGFMVGWPLGTAIAGGDANWALAGIGAGLIVISIPFTSAYNKHTKAAVHLYNGGLNKSSLGKLDFKIRPYGAGLTIQIKF